MSEIDKSKFIGNYEVSSFLASSQFCELYEARSVHQSTLPVILTFWPELGIHGEEEAHTFQQKVRHGIIHSNAHIVPILDAGVDSNEHPYIVTPYSEENVGIWQQHIFFIDQVLQEAQKLHPDDTRALIPAFLDLFMSKVGEEEPSMQATSLDQSYSASLSFDQAYPVATDPARSSAASPGLGTDGPSPRPAKARKVKWYQVALLVFLLILLVWGGSALYALIPASSATITITPMKQQLTRNYSFGVVTGKPAAFDVQGRLISITSQHISKTVPATGKGHHNATQARGTLVFSQIHYFNPSRSDLFYGTTASYTNGTQITTENVVHAPEGSTMSMSAHITQAGSAGNIPAYYVNEPTTIINIGTKVQIGTAYTSNPAPFTGGTDARDFTSVQQSDLDHVTQPFLSQVTSATQERVIKQIRTGEYLAKGVQCVPAISSNHRVKDEASDVTVQASLTCQALVYSKQAVDNAATHAYQHDGVAKFGDGYVILGDMLVGTITALNGIVNDTPQLLLNVTAIWSFQYTDARRQEIGRIIAGKSQDTVRLLLHARKDVQNVTISTSGVPGSALPSSPSHIAIVVKKVTGLRTSS
jgi:hypothetical protein